MKAIEKEEAIKIEELEIARREKELESSVVKPADARKYQIKAEAEAEEFRIQAEAKGKAEALRAEGEVEAEIMKKKGLAEAESMLKKAQAWEKYNQAAVLEMYLKTLPDLAKAVSEPLSKVDKIVVIGGGDKSLGTTKITAQVAEVLAQMPDVVKSLTGVDLKKYLQDKFSPEEKKRNEPPAKRQVRHDLRKSQPDRRLADPQDLGQGQGHEGRGDRHRRPQRRRARLPHTGERQGGRYPRHPAELHQVHRERRHPGPQEGRPRPDEGGLRAQLRT